MSDGLRPRCRLESTARQPWQWKRSVSVLITLVVLNERAVHLSPLLPASLQFLVNMTGKHHKYGITCHI